MQEQDKTQYIGCGKVKKVMVLKTSEEVKQARMRQRRKERYKAMQQTMLQAVEQAVALPEPLPKPAACEQVAEETTTQENIETKSKREGIGQSLINTVRGAKGSVASFFNRIYSAMMEED